MPDTLVWTVNNKARFSPCLDLILKYEGSVFTNDPDDRGGATKYGVIQERYNEYRKDTGKPVQSVRYIEMPEVTSIYACYYWNAINADNLPAPYDLAVFNCAVNSGPARAKKFQAEVEAANPGASPLVLARAFCDRYERFYKAIVANDSSQAKFLRGWLNRLNDVRLHIEEAAATGTGAGDWDVFVGDSSIAAAFAWANPNDSYRAYVPLRSFLLHFFKEKEVSAKLALKRGDAYWAGTKMPVAEVQRLGQGGVSETWVPVRELGDWLQLDVLVDGKLREITLVRPSGAAKAQG